MRQLLANSPAWWDRDRWPPPCWLVQVGLGLVIGIASLRRFLCPGGPLVGSEFSRPRTVRIYSTLGEPSTCGGLICCRSCRWRSVALLRWGRRWPPFRAFTSSAIGQYGPLTSPLQPRSCWLVAALGAGTVAVWRWMPDTGPSSGNALFPLFAAAARERGPWLVAIALCWKPAAGRLMSLHGGSEDSSNNFRLQRLDGRSCR